MRLRRIDLAVSLAGLLLPLVSAGCSGHKSDTSLKTHIQGAIAGDSALTGQSIQVEVRNGVAVLSGTVSSQDQLQEAVKDADVRNLLQIIDELTVGPPPDEASAVASLRTLIAAETKYSTAYPAVGFADSLDKLGPATTTPDENHAGLIDAALATGTKDNYQFFITIPAGTSVAGTNFNYWIAAEPVAGNGGRIFCTDSSGRIHYVAQGGNCTKTSPTL